MEKEILKEICKNLNWKERILVKIFRKTFMKVYKLGLIRCFNYYNS